MFRKFIYQCLKKICHQQYIEEFQPFVDHFRTSNQLLHDNLKTERVNNVALQIKNTCLKVENLGLREEIAALKAEALKTTRIRTRDAYLLLQRVNEASSLSTDFYNLTRAEGDVVMMDWAKEANDAIAVIPDFIMTDQLKKDIREIVKVDNLVSLDDLEE